MSARENTPRLPRLASGTPAWLAGAWALAGLSLATRRAAGLTAAASAAAGAATLFFRDPPRTPGAAGLLAAADGVVKSVDALPDGRTRVATYMSLRDVHVNRAPADGRVVALEHRPGGYLPAFRKESERNERLEWTIETDAGRIDMVQIAGTLARRIVPYLEVGQSTSRGGRIGLIRFGSRVDVYLPAGVPAAVVPGQRVRAGRTRLDRG